MTFLRVMGLDIGTKRVGVAVSDELGISANAKGIFEYTDERQLIEEIKKRIKEFCADSVVVGLPVNMNGSLGGAAKQILNIVEVLKKQVNIPVCVFDERLSTVMAQNVLLSADLSRKKRKKLIDTTAAQIILQDYLSARKKVT